MINRCTLGLFGLLFWLPFSVRAGEERAPNFVVILIDDMGYGDIEPFGSKTNKTPHLQRMAEEGMKLTSFYMAACCCTPSRAALLTGCYPARVGLEVGSWSPAVLFPKDAHGINPSEITVAEMLKAKGYATGCFGKWHLGDQPEFLPTKHGFDRYVGIPYSNDMWPPHPTAKNWKFGAPPLPVLRDDKVVEIVKTMEDQANLCKLFTDEAVTFIKENKERPFFVYVPHAFVHHPRMARPEFMKRAGLQGEADETKSIRDSRYLRQQRTRAQIEEIDWSVGQILDTIRELKLSKNTFVLFTSDNGGASGTSMGPLRGGKGSTWEGGLRVPTVAWWPGRVPAGKTCGELTTAMDLLPTFASWSGAEVPKDRKIDGKDIGSLLLGEVESSTPYDRFFYYKFADIKAVRSGKWKLHTNGSLYDLAADLGERKNVDGAHPEVVKRLQALLNEGRRVLAPENCRPVGKVKNPQYLTEK